MKLLITIAVVAAQLGANVLAAETILKGTAGNGTTGKPAGGLEVILMSLTGGTAEIAHSRTGAGGGFQFTVGDSQPPYLVRVVHQGVVYQSMAPAGMQSVEVQVYDAARQLDGVIATWDMQRFESAGGKLQVIEEMVLRNASDPPRTLINERPFEIQLPPEAEVVAGKVQIGSGQPIIRTPSPGGEKGRYYFPFPLLPGDTRFAIAYRLPYGGEAVIEPKILYPLGEFVVVLPKSMKFEAKTPGLFQPMASERRDVVQMTGAVKPGQPVAFRISGTGMLATSRGGPQKAQDAAERARPGSGPAAPARLPSPRHNDRWLFLGGLALVLAASAAGFLAHKRKLLRRVEG